MRLQTVTMTGADDSVEPEQLFQLSQEYPFVEWGILASASRNGSPRFPSTDWRDHLLKTVPDNVQLCLHLCGRWVENLLVGRQPDLTGVLTPRYQRVQLNFHRYAVSVDPNVLAESLLLAFGPRRPLIFQFDGDSGQHYLDEAYQARSAYADQLRLYPLFDLSGGAGIAPAQWPEPYYMEDDTHHSLHGYAGGLGPHNLEQQLPLIAAAAGEHTPVWIDAETHVRSSDDRVFDLEKVRAFLEICKPHVAAH